ncbi:hypothetical protein SAMN06269301_3537 [Geobacter sp. DSM 9736]|nr:hypothetical protein SAMN06269301_3537 [Geobacter sp. DSM 9736]
MGASFLTLPWFLFTYLAEGRGDASIKGAEALMLVGRLALLIYVLLVFQQLLNKHYAFTGANKTISLFIQASTIQVAARLLALAVPELADAVALFGLIMLVIIGVIHLMFGIWLLYLPASLGGMHRPFCYLNIATGLAFASIVLLPVGMLTSTIADLMLGTILLQTARLPRLT